MFLHKLCYDKGIQSYQVKIRQVVVGVPRSWRMMLCQIRDKGREVLCLNEVMRFCDTSSM
jgi:hypothetical protein